ncbi:hypothetical protein F2Q69_00020770 [Brassica cretica]|uniref:Uncharacterized protein n=1 Tax=Brassica cretica TaxID=69181 RepID=A0A8S9QA81_BRACR|nr:hypothetical protein F2Q69_00020770 [Brassica cretica]
MKMTQDAYEEPRPLSLILTEFLNHGTLQTPLLGSSAILSCWNNQENIVDKEKENSENVILYTRISKTYKALLLDGSALAVKHLSTCLQVSVLIYKETEICLLSSPELLYSVLSLLHTKSIEIIKVSLQAVVALSM